MIAKKRTGRPSTFTQATADVICERIAAGESLRSICAEDGMPGLSVVFQWLNAQPSFADQYARARETQADTLADEMLDISRGKSADQVANADRRLLLDTLKWRAGKLRPKVYGDRQTVDQNVSGEIAHTVRVVLSDE